MNILVFTGAGISRESGLKTFRDEDGLWAGCKVESVCSTSAWRNNPELVLDFYNQRRREILEAVPNAAHFAIAELEKNHNVTVVTQNIDNLHERAGSTNVLHLHGEINKKRTDESLYQFYPCEGDINIGDIDPESKGRWQYRPHVVFFGEMPYNYDESVQLSKDCNVLVIIGTSLQVSPASNIARKTRASRTFIIDPNPDKNIVRKLKYRTEVKIFAENAGNGVPKVCKHIIELNK